MRAPIARRTLGAALSIAVAAGWAMAAAMPVHAQSVTGLGQADQQFNRCQVLLIGDAVCGNTSQEGAARGWQLSIAPFEPAVGHSPCRRSVANE
jgi:hypothetical protein